LLTSNHKFSTPIKLLGGNDTDHISVFDRGGQAAQPLLAKLARISPDEAATTIITYEEQIRGWLDYTARRNRIDEQIAAYRKLERHLANYRKILVLSFDENAEEIYQAYIEVRFRTLVHLLGGFAYQFWLKAINKTPRFPVNLCLTQSVWRHFPRWFRTLPKHGYLTEQIVRLAIQHQQAMLFSRSRPTLLLPQFLANKIE
jgi:hypothetical protein